MVDILLFQKLSCFIISVISPLHLLSVCKHSFFGLAKNCHAGTDSRFADGLCSCLYEYMLLFCMRKKAGRADFLHEKSRRRSCKILITVHSMTSTRLCLN